MEYFENEKSFLYDIKSIFHNFQGLSFDEIRKMADTSWSKKIFAKELINFLQSYFLTIWKRIKTEGRRSSIDIEVIRTVFIFIFFYEEILSIYNTN